MDSPLSKFLEWFYDLPVKHQTIISIHVSMINDSFKEIYSVEDPREVHKDTAELIKLFAEKIKKTIDQDKMAELGFALSIRSQIDFFFFQNQFWESFFFQSSQVDGFFKKVQEETNSSEFHWARTKQNWDMFSNNFFTDQYLESWRAGQKITNA
jgi:hypothetical protein